VDEIEAFAERARETMRRLAASAAYGA